MKSLLNNGKIVTYRETFRGSIEIDDQKITNVYQGVQEVDDLSYDAVFDCKGKIIIPGIIDPHVHLRDWGQNYKETIETGTNAARFGGVTSALTMPNTEPRLTNMKLVSEYMELIKSNSYIDVGVFMNVSDDFTLSEIEDAASKGVKGLKIYPGDQSQSCQLEWEPLLKIEKLLREKYLDAEFEKNELEQDFKQEMDNLYGGPKFSEQIVNWQKLFFYVSDYDLPLLFHPDTPIPQLTRRNIFENLKNNKYSDLESHSKTYTIFHETLFVLYILKILEVLLTNLKTQNLDDKLATVCFCHVSSPQPVLAINEYRARNSNIDLRIEIAPHHIFLNHSMKKDMPAYMKVLQPVRSKKIMLEMQDLLKTGYMDYIGTDHAPHSIEEKRQDFLNAPSGISGLDVYVKFVLSRVLDEFINLKEFVRLSSLTPSRIFKLRNKGDIKVGYDADILVFSDSASYSLDTENFKSKAKWTPYDTSNLRAKLNYVFLRGRLIMTDDESILQEYPQLKENYDKKNGKTI